MLFESQVTAVIELATFRRFNDIHLTFFDQLTESIAIVLNTIAASMRTEELLKQSQSLTEELQSQQNELRETNQRLEQQARSLQVSEDLLKNQQEQLKQTNEELEEKARLLAQQNQEVEGKNQEIEQARLAVEDKAAQLSLTSKYKSEFLANMSHELRTPLNSLLLLAQLLVQNTAGNLSEKQVEYAQTIYSAGNELLNLINDILDLAKIESGTMAVQIDQMLLKDIHGYTKRTFHQIAQDKGLNFQIEFSPTLLRAIYTDAKRLQQVLKNLLSNAFKFTEQGQVCLRVEAVSSGWSHSEEALNCAELVLAFAVQDTGIGIPKNKQKVIFEAFQQVDGTTSRKYGTGLGFSISREIAKLLGGEIALKSEVGVGSTFTLYIPQAYLSNPDRTHHALPSTFSLASRSSQALKQKLNRFTPTKVQLDNSLGSSLPASDRLPPHPNGDRPHAVSQIPQPDTPLALPDIAAQPTILIDDRDNIKAGDGVLLIVDDDVNFVHILLEKAREKGLKGIVALQGDIGLQLAHEFQPDAIFLDIMLPRMDGWTVLDQLKHDHKTRHIPVQIITIAEIENHRGLRQGALSCLQKPVSNEQLSQTLDNIKNYIQQEVKNLLLVEDDAAERDTIVKLIGNSDVCTTTVSTAAAALEAIEAQHFDCILLSSELPDTDTFEPIGQIQQRVNQISNVPVPTIVYTAADLTPEDRTALMRLSTSLIVKDQHFKDSLLDMTALFLHRNEANLPTEQQKILAQLHQKSPEVAGKKVLIVDDDVRNVFALANILELYQIKILYAENGREGIDMLYKEPDIDIVLMDVMMPEMDGYETMRTIRQQAQFQSLPILALTAKAMPGDREKCIAAGASDYIPKPVNVQQLLSLMRVWLYERSYRDARL